MEAVQYLDHPAASHPPFLCAFRGWNDGGEAASVALRYLQERWPDPVIKSMSKPGRSQCVTDVYDFVA